MSALKATKTRPRRASDDLFGGDVDGELPDELFGRELPTTFKSKEKGDQNERALAKWIAKWSGIEMLRVPSSGGRRVGGNFAFVGDLAPKDLAADFPFVVETKHWKEAIISTLEGTRYLRRNSIFYTVWKQVFRDVERTGNLKVGLTFVRENGMKGSEWYVTMPLALGEWVESRYEVKCLAFSGPFNKGAIMVFNSEDILRVPYEKFCAKAKHLYLRPKIT